MFFVGHVTVLAFYSPDNYLNLIEVNPRFGGASNLSIVAGLDSPHRLIAILYVRIAMRFIGKELLDII